jgi:hypothetical protein
MVLLMLENENRLPDRSDSESTEMVPMVRSVNDVPVNGSATINAAEAFNEVAARTAATATDLIANLAMDFCISCSRS